MPAHVQMSNTTSRTDLHACGTPKPAQNDENQLSPTLVHSSRAGRPDGALLKYFLRSNRHTEIMQAAGVRCVYSA